MRCDIFGRGCGVSDSSVIVVVFVGFVFGITLFCSFVAAEKGRKRRKKSPT